jgi:Bacterial protein of unknown function (DUF899)
MEGNSTTYPLPEIVDRATRQAGVDRVLAREKAHTRERDAIAAAPWRLPMVEVDARDGDRLFETYWTTSRGVEDGATSYPARSHRVRPAGDLRGLNPLDPRLVPMLPAREPWTLRCGFGLYPFARHALATTYPRHPAVLARGDPQFGFHPQIAATDAEQQDYSYTCSIVLWRGAIHQRRGGARSVSRAAGSG